LDARTYRELRRIPAISIALRLQIRSDRGSQLEMRVNLGQELGLLCASGQGHETNEESPFPKRLAKQLDLSRCLGHGAPLPAFWASTYDLHFGQPTQEYCHAKEMF
jgi:hypothetical protein